MRLLTGLIFFSYAFQSQAAVDLAWANDLDLTHFVTRPELKAPRFDVTIYEPDRVTPGYWFVAPYTEINQKQPPPRYYQPCQTGPHIFDSDGELIYSGACVAKNQNSCDFRAWNFNGTSFLTAIRYFNADDPTGRAVIMDNSYRIIQEILPKSTETVLNMHEFNLVDGGKSALYITHRTEYVDLEGVRPENGKMGNILNLGFREIDLASGATLFEWWAHPEVSLTESTAAGKNARFNTVQGWNWFHGNSVDKNAVGDYILSARFTDTIYKISGRTGRIVWRLGGTKSDFDLQGFNFSRQHDAHWIEEECTPDKEIITFLDNGGDETTESSTYSSGLEVELDLPTMTAAVRKRWIRPDEGRSRLRGNFQRLPGGNYFAGWSDNAYVSEHTPDGRLVMEAEFASSRMVTYRAYKLNFTGSPVDAPVVKAFVYGVDAESSTTASYVSWNGATEVDRWRFYNLAGDLIGSARRQGFETRLLSKGAETEVYAEAIAADGSVLGRSETYAVEMPPEWTLNAAEESGEDEMPEPQSTD